MKFKTALLIIALGATAPAFAAGPSTPLTREQVRAETLRAISNGELMSGESSLSLRQINPRAYPAAAPVASKSRSQVVNELNRAIQSGDMMAAGESGAKLNEIAPGNYPAQNLAAGPSKTRDQVQHELAEAIIHGEMMANGEDGRMLNEVFPGMYRGSHAQDVAAESGSASGTRGF